MQNITGKGAAPLLKDIPDVVSPAGYYNGQCFLVAKFAGVRVRVLALECVSVRFFR